MSIGRINFVCQQAFTVETGPEPYMVLMGYGGSTEAAGMAQDLGGSHSNCLPPSQ